MKKELPWIKLARTFVGIKEVKGIKHHPEIIRWLGKMGEFNNEAKAWWRDDETPWCGLFVGYVLGECGRYVVREWYRAKSWTQQMTKLDKPAYGCLAVMDRVGGGHVGFVVGRDDKGRLMILGGNQSDMVSIAPFNTSREMSFYWPSFYRRNLVATYVTASKPNEDRYDLPVITHSSKESTNEA